MNFVPCPDMSTYREHVWAYVRQVPRGQVVTYGQIMNALEQPEQVSSEEYRLSASRWVGSAMAACPDDVPWHRVVNAQGKISHQSAAQDQQQLLNDEGVLFANGKIDLKLFQWRAVGDIEEPMQGQLF